jgi:hypothetical protein
VSTMTDEQIAEARNFAASQATPVLVANLLAFRPRIAEARALAEKTSNYYDVYALMVDAHWTRETLMNRYPAAVAAVEKAYDEAPADGRLVYDTVLLAAIPEDEKCH